MIRAFLVCLAAVCGAAHAERTEVYAGLALLDFRNKAYFDDEYLYREDGSLPGLALEVARTIDGWRLSADGRLFSGNTDFQFIPLEGKGESDERIYSLSLRIARELPIDGWSLAPYAGYGYHRRQRDSKLEFGTFTSVYTWRTAEVGAFLKTPAWGRFEAGIDVRVFRVREPEVELRFGDPFGDVRIPLGEHSGARYGLVGTYLLESGLRIRVDLYYERWSFGQGEQVLRSGPNFTVSAVEPRNEFRNTGVTLGLVFGF